MHQLSKQEILDLTDGYHNLYTEAYKIVENNPPEILFGGKTNILIKHYNGGAGTLVETLLQGWPKYDSEYDIFDCGDLAFEDYLLKIYVR